MGEEKNEKVVPTERPGTLQAIVDALAPTPLAPEYEAAMKTLQEAAGAMVSALGPRVRVHVEPGPRDEFAFVVYVREPYTLREVLFRGRTAGFPVVLDFFEDTRRICHTTDEVLDAIVHFLKRPDVKRRLWALRQLAED